MYALSTVQLSIVYIDEAGPNRASISTIDALKSNICPSDHSTWAGKIAAEKKLPIVCRTAQEYGS